MLAVTISVLYTGLLLLDKWGEASLRLSTVPCPGAIKCNCTYTTTEQGETTYASCRGAGLASIPTLPNNSVQIDLSQNNIRQLKDGVFQQYPQLTSLNLSFNSIAQLNSTAFQGLGWLETLDLGCNIIPYAEKSIRVNAFEPLVNLTYLNIKQNVTDNQFYPNAALSKLQALTNLLINGLPSAVLGQGIAGFPRLLNLTFSGTCLTSSCNISRLGDETFRNVRNVKHLDCSACNITQIANNSFRSLTGLQYLDVSDNRELSLAAVPNLTLALLNTSIETLRLNRIVKLYGGCNVLSKHDVQYLRNLSSLKELHVDGNRLSYVDGEVINKFPEALEVLSVRNNILKSSVPFSLALLVNLKKLRVLYISDQYLDSFGFDIPSSANSDKSVLETPPLTIDVDVTRNTRQRFRREVLPPIITLPPNLQYVDSSNMHLRGITLVASMIPKNNLTTVLLHSNLLQRWVGPMCNLDKLTTLDLSNNLCNSMTKDFLQAAKLEHLLLGKNLLGDVLYRDKDGEIFKNLPSLKCLDLSENMIRDLPEEIFVGLRNLTRLHLNKNGITDVGFKITHMDHLKHLDLSNNSIQTIRESVRTAFDSFGPKFHLDISWNAFSCSCDNLAFLHWIRSTKKVSFDRKDDIFCVLKNGNRVEYKDFAHYLSDLETRCKTHLLEYVLVASTSVTVLVVLVTLLTYRYRWKLRYLYYTVRRRGRFRHGEYQRLEGDENRFEKDVFLLHADEDVLFIRREFIRVVEDGKGLSLLIPERDFMAFESVAENIMTSILTCRKTVVVMTPAFIRNQWCMYGMSMAYMEGIYSRRNVLCIIMKESVPLSDIPLEVLSMFRSKTYLEFPESTEDEEVFWQELLEEL